jgi:hypothetical protein
MIIATNVKKARDAWGDELPGWVLILAQACDSSSQVKVAKKLGYSNTVVSSVLARTYTGNLNAVEKTVEGAFKSVTVKCPVLEEISAAKCITEQRRPFGTSSDMRVKLYQACRGKRRGQNGVPCEHFLGSKDK